MWRTAIPKLLAVLVLCSIGLPQNAVSPSQGKGGVGDGTCWGNSQHNIAVGIRGTLHGDQVVTVTMGDDSGTGTGTPDPFGGCDSSSAITVGDESFRASDGEMQWKNDNGDWVDMSEEDCPSPDTQIAGGGPPFNLGGASGPPRPGGDSVGSLPSEKEDDPPLALPTLKTIVLPAGSF